MGNCCSRSKDTTESEATDGSNGRGDEHASLADVGIGTANLVADSILLVGGAVPVVGDFFDLIAHFTTPLDAASQHGHPAVVRLLLDAQR